VGECKLDEASALLKEEGLDVLLHGEALLHPTRD
jgi:hypothetical protein